MKRERLQVIHDILKSCRKSNVKKTHIMYKANLSPQMLDTYLKDLMGKEFIEKKNDSYNLTDKGFKYLQEYNTIINFMDSFGLN